MAPYGMLYGGKFRTPLHWDEVGEKQILGREAVREATEVVAKIRQRMLTAQCRQRSYTDLKRRELEFSLGDQVFLRVSLMKRVMHFGKKRKLNPRYIGPFEILEKVGQVAYRLTLPPALAETYNVFHISMLRKYVPVPSHVLSYELLELKQYLSYDEQLVELLEAGVKELMLKKISLVKVLWKNCSTREAIWVLEEDMRERYPELFGKGQFQGRNSFYGG
ncbi:uncharacterized protein LOC133779606 [Humulus lupulus]|uniref:uncharacterized protein LOC133779606 n=1 Tax=Humulus lupulus TaxID=3486 RepID=UPI002B40A699|nr:uncharacterized protein LOC133779606 [Humulus lupulus]